jgi:hypothetical protein
LLPELREFVIEFSEEVVKGASGTVAFLFEKGTGTTGLF